MSQSNSFPMHANVTLRLEVNEISKKNTIYQSLKLFPPVPEGVEELELSDTLIEEVPRGSRIFLGFDT